MLVEVCVKYRGPRLFITTLTFQWNLRQAVVQIV